MTRPPSVLHVLAPAAYGGLESVVTALARAQVAAGGEVSVACVVASRSAHEDFLGGLASVGATVHPLVIPGRSYLVERSALADLVRSSGSQVMHTHGYRPDIVDAPIGRRSGLATVTTVHGFTGGSIRNRFYQWLQRRAFRRFDAVVAVSQKLRTELSSGVAPERLHVVRNAWDPESRCIPRAEARRSLGLSEHTPTVGWVGRMTPEKGPDVMLRAFGALAGSDVRLSMIGDGPMTESLVESARLAGVEERVRFHGAVPGAGRYLPAFDTVVLSSWTEGTPMVLLEAMGARIPVVSTAVGGVPEVIGEEDGLLVPAGDHAALAAGIRTVLDDPEAARGRALSAYRRLLRDFSPESWAERYGAIYRQALGSR